MYWVLKRVFGSGLVKASSNSLALSSLTDHSFALYEFVLTLNVVGLCIMTQWWVLHYMRLVHMLREARICDILDWMVRRMRLG